MVSPLNGPLGSDSCFLLGLGLQQPLSEELSYPFDFNVKDEAATSKRVLSVDGGGMRGIIPARILQAIEERTHSAAAKLFDVMAGSSTGALVTMGLNAVGEDGEPKHSARDIVEFYRQEGESIFPDPTSWGIFAPKYSAEGLNSVLQRYFGDALLKDTYTDSFIPAYDIRNDRPYHFSRTQVDRHPGWDTLTQRDVLRCTTAAPVYLPSVALTIGGEKHNFVDGGVFANNPSAYAALYTQEVYRPCTIDLLCSIGTGVKVTNIEHYDSSGWGVYGWGFEFPQLVLRSQSNSAHQAMTHLLPSEGPGQKYYRFQAPLAHGVGGLDCADPWSVQCLIDHAEALIEDQEDQINNLCEKLRPDGF